MTRLQPRHALYAVLALAGVVCAAGLGRALLLAGYTIPLDPNEGWNAYHTAAMMAGHALYPGAEAYIVNNYPPLSYYVVGLAGWFIGDNIIAGRIVSFLALGAIAAVMAFVVRGRGRAARLLPGLWLVAGLVTTTDYVGMDDPQMLAHAVSLAGLAVLLRQNRKPYDTALAAALFVAAFFVKHAVVALPAAAFIWLLLAERKRALELAGYGLALLVGGLIAFRLAYGVSLFAVVSTARMYSVTQLLSSLGGWLHWTGPAILTLIALTWFCRRDRLVQLCALYAAISIVIGTYFLGGAGVDPNVMFDADIALAMALGLAVSQVKRWKAPALAAVLVAPQILVAAINTEWQTANLDWPLLRHEAGMARGDIAFMTAQKGPAMCEMLSFCYWAKKPAAVDMFNVGQQFETETRSDAEVVRDVDAKRYAVIQFDPGEPYALGDNVYEALMRSYRLHHSDDFGTFYVPK